MEKLIQMNHNRSVNLLEFDFRLWESHSHHSLCSLFRYKSAINEQIAGACSLARWHIIPSLKRVSFIRASLSSDLNLIRLRKILVVDKVQNDVADADFSFLLCFHSVFFTSCLFEVTRCLLAYLLACFLAGWKTYGG